MKHVILFGLILMSWKSYDWERGQIAFNHPPNWRVAKVMYQTPAQELAGEPAEEIGLTVTAKNKKGGEIVIGGRQVDCEWQTFWSRCQVVAGWEVYTLANDSQTLQVFDGLVASIESSK